MNPLSRFPAPIPAAAARHRRRALSLLARGNWSPTATAALHRFVSASGERRAAPLALHAELLPLIVENLRRAGVHWAGVFEGDEPAVDEGALLLNYVQRRGILADAVAAMKRAGVSRVVLLKGCAVAARYDAPPCRTMGDVDVAVTASELNIAAKALKSAGWRTVGQAKEAIFRHRTGLHLDLHTPHGALGERAWEHAVPASDSALNAAWTLAPEDHFALTALHTLSGHGERFWRDLADARALSLDPAFDRRQLRAIVRAAREDRTRAALLAVWREWGSFDARIRHLCGSLPEMHAAESETELAARRLLRHTQVATAGEEALHLARRLVRPAKEVLRSVAGALRPASRAGVGEGTFQSALSSLSPEERRAAAIALGAAGLLTATGRHYLEVARLQYRCVPSLLPFVCPKLP